jgi:UDP-N-acetylglucosamine--N-acetylmuramyl-(pentapeptide) pyrophosphoryl-undecaprenol N-acetylglucosamine transferase
LSAAKTKYRFLFAGGGTGGHLFPAVAVAQKIKIMLPEAEILFVGTKSKIEGKVVPQLGYKFKPIWIKGFSRKLNMENLLFPLKLSVSLLQSLAINISFRPKVAIGSGGYVSGPAIFGAALTGAKVILLEQNSYPGVTTKILEKYAQEVHVSFENSVKYFKTKNKVFVTGNPVRQNLSLTGREEALKAFDLDPSKKTLLVLGGSLGAGTLNEAMAQAVKMFEAENINVIWQTGKYYYEKYKDFDSDCIKVKAFIDDMNLAYSACDLMVSRSGATTIAELAVLGIPSILVPSPNVAENHQYYNAKSLSDNNAAILVKDNEIKEIIFQTVASVINDNQRLTEISRNAKLLGRPDAAEVIARKAIKYAQAL